MGKFIIALKFSLPFLFLLLISGSCFSQQDSLISRTIKPNEDFFFTEDPDFMVSQIPEKWQNESAVILCRKYNYSYHKKKNFKNKEDHRVQLQILDQSAVDYFTTFFFPYATESHFGIQIRKKNGSTYVVDMSSSEIVPSPKVPNYFFSSHYQKYKQIKLENLEIGDILDFKYLGEIETNLSLAKSTAAVAHILTTPYPIIKQRYDIEFSTGLVFVGRTFNLKNTFVETEINHLDNSKMGDNTQYFSFEDTNREKSKQEIWKYPTVDEPSIKIHIRNPNYDPMGKKLLVDDQFIINQPYNLTLIQENEILKTQILSYSGDIEALIRKLKKERGNYKSNADFTNEIYYRLRDNYTRGKIQTPNGIDLSGRTYTVDDVSFTNTFSLVLSRLDVPHKLVVAAKRTIPSLENVVFPNEMSRAIKVGNTYFFPFSNFTTVDYIPEYLLGAQAIEFDYEYPFEITELPASKKVVLPSKTYNKNLITNKHTITVSNDLQSLNTSILRTFEGLSKVRNIRPAVYQFNYLDSEEPVKEYSLKEGFQSINTVSISRNNEKVAVKSPKENKNKNVAYFWNQRKKDYPVSSYSHFDLISVGRDQNNPNLVYKEHFTINGLIQPKGNEYEFEIGKLIGKQLELQLSDLDRESNIHLDFANGFRNTYLITLPEGYTISDLEPLNYELTNSMGAFNCEATINKNVLRLTVNKYFKAQDAEAKDWPQFAEIINTANTFTQVVVSIEKGN